MNNKSLKTKVITGALTIGMILSTTAIGFAAVNNSKSANGNKSSKTQFTAPMNRGKFDAAKQTEMKAALEAVLKEGVSSNIITQDESDKVLAYETKKATDMAQGTAVKPANGKGNGKGNGGLFQEVVSQGILTQAKADALDAKMNAQREATEAQKTSDGLKTLVDNKTLTQDQADKINAAFKAEESARAADFEKMKNMTDAERKTYMDSNKTNKVNPIQALITDGTITQAQADAIAKTLPMGHGGFGGQGIRGHKGMGNCTNNTQTSTTTPAVNQ